MKRKICNQYYITVEGETEKIYLDRLKSLINDVKSAIYRAETLMDNIKNCATPKMYKKYKYFAENPSLNIHEFIKMVFKDTEII